MDTLLKRTLPNLATDWPAPLERNNYLFTFAFFALAAFAGSASAALFIGAGIWAIMSIGFYRFEPVLERDAKLLGLVFAFYFLSGAVNAVAHWGDRESLFLIAQRLPFLAFIPVLSRLSLSNGKATLEALENGAFAGAILVFPVVLFQLATPFARPEAFSGNPAALALAATVLFSVCCVAARRRGGTAELYFIAAAAAAAFCVLVSGTRAFWPMLLVAPVAAWFFIRRSEQPGRLNWMLAAAVFAAFLVGSVTTSDRLSLRVELLMEEVSEGDAPADHAGSLASRMAMWRCAVSTGAQHPLLGAGVDGARQAMVHCAEADGRRWQALSHFHNFVLDAFAKGGLLDVIARILALLVPPFVVARLALRRGAEEPLARPALVLTGLVTASFLASGTFGIFLGHDIIDALYLYGFICLYTVAARHERAGNET